jgi:sugar phosphate isomerase/epimerase
MYATLNTGAIGVTADSPREAIAAARIGGFKGVELRAPQIADLIDEIGVEATRSLFEEARVRPAVWGLGLDWRGDEATWQQGLEGLRRSARAMATIGCVRAIQVIFPGDDEREFDANWQFHVARLAPAAAILAEHGCALGLEFIGPKTLRDTRRYPFVHTLGKALELGAAFGPNVGLLLDCWHWYTAHDTLDTLHGLRPEQIVHVHINDAPLDIPIDEQIDNRRALPGETGVIDIVGFLRALQAIGYDGPVTAEPFKQELRDLPNDAERLALVRESISLVFHQAGVALD